MDKEVTWITLGRFGRPHGIKGFITIQSCTEPRDNIVDYEHLYAYINNEWRSLHLLNIEVTDKHIMAQVEGFNTREQVAGLTNIPIGTPKSELPELQQGEFYWHDLIGLAVVNQKGDALGTIIEILPTGSNDVLVVSGEQRVLIPYLPEHTILDVNLKEQRMIVDWDLDY